MLQISTSRASLRNISRKIWEGQVPKPRQWLTGRISIPPIQRKRLACKCNGIMCCVCKYIYCASFCARWFFVCTSFVPYRLFHMKGILLKAHIVSLPIFPLFGIPILHYLSFVRWIFRQPPARRKEGGDAVFVEEVWHSIRAPLHSQQPTWNPKRDYYFQAPR